MPDYENRKKILEASKEVFPHIPVGVIVECISENVKKKMRKDFKEMGEDFDLFEKQLKEMKVIRTT